jgi:hypothetical protein
MKLTRALCYRERDFSIQTWRGHWALGLLFSVCLIAWTRPANAQATHSDTTVKPTEVETWKLTIHPAAESKPSLKIKLLPDPTEQLDGNAAVFYLKAMGFLEQEGARDRIREIYKNISEQVKATGKPAEEFPPYSYQEMHPRDYPKKEVREFLDLLSFQELSLREARRFREFSMYRNLQLSDNPIGYLLPEMQAIRELARNQRIRCRLAIAENRIDDAIEVIGQQVTMSHHMGQDDFLVSYLIGADTLRIALDDSLVLVEHADCPNLYWSFAQLPSPLISLERSLAAEKQFLYMQVPKLKEVSTTPLPEGYWTLFIEEFSKRTADIDAYNDGSEVTIVSKAQGEERLKSVQKSVLENAPKAREYLLSRGILTADTIDTYAKEQLVFLAMKDYYDVRRDEHFKWCYLPYQVSRERIASANAAIKKDQERYGWFTGVTINLLPSIDAVNEVVTRTRLRIAMIQVIEAIKMAGAENGGKLIESLNQAPVPVPNNPYTDKPFSYQVSGDTAVLSSDFPEALPIRIELKFAK